MIYIQTAFNIFIFCYIGEIVTEQVISRNQHNVFCRLCKSSENRTIYFLVKYLYSDFLYSLYHFYASLSNRIVNLKIFVLIYQCKNIGRMAYMADWYKLDYKIARSFILIIAQSNSVIKITAGKLFQLSIATFGDVSHTNCHYNNVVLKNI